MGRKACFVVSSPLTAKSFLLDFASALMSRHQVCIVANFSGNGRERRIFGDIETEHVPIERKISPWADLKALIALYALFRKRHFDIVHSVTPKAGLLAMIAAWGARVPLRFHTFTGQVWATRTGLFRWLLKSLDRIIVRCSTEVLVDSFSQQDFLLGEKVIDKDRTTVLASGSICGVDIHRFRPDPETRRSTRAAMGIPADAFVYLFAGRLNREKGIGELLQAFSRITVDFPEAYLVLVGPDEEGMLHGEGGADAGLSRVISVGYSDAPEKYMSAADVFCLPSHREGFGLVIIEAAAAGLPAIGSAIYGISDAIVHGETGLLHERQNVPALYTCMKEFISDRGRTTSLGKNAMQRARELFSKERLVQAFLDFYEKRLHDA